MELTERSYGGKLFRPRPEVFISDDKKLFIMATPWGPRKMAQAFIDKVTSELQDFSVDPDHTIYSMPSDTMSEKESRLRLVLLSLHEDLREEFNNENLSSGLEILCLLKDGKKISWFKIGAPFLAMLRTNHLLPLHHPLDLSFDHSTTETLPPLPKQLYGLSQNINLEQGSFLHRKGDRLLLVSRSHVPFRTFELPPDEMNLENLTLSLANDNVDQPFWLGLLAL
jgi:hypothetical protein